jgi:hypothetical protein
MKLLLVHFVLIFVTMSLAAPTFAADDLSAQGLLSVAKMAGACGILDSMIQLQKSTNISGGNEFVSRFWTVEAARLGYTVKQLSETCDKSIAAYNRLWTTAKQDQVK